MKRSLLLFLLLAVYFYFEGTGQPEPAYRALYHRAEQFYNAAEPTAATDSLAQNLYERVAQLLEKSGANDTLLIDSYTKAAILSQMKGDDPGAIILFGQALKAADKNPAASDSLRFYPLLYCGSSHYTLNRFDSARYYYQLAERVVDRYPRMPERERLYNKLGTLCYEQSDFHQALNYFTKALSLLDTTNAANNFLLVNYYNNIALTFKKLGRYNEALHTYQLLLRYRIQTDDLVHNLATVYLDLRQPEKALQYLHAVRTRRQQQYNNMALAHLQAQRPDSAAIYVQKAFDSRTHPFKNTVNGLSWYYLARVQEMQRQYEKALHTYHRAVIELDPDFNDSSIAGNPTQFRGMHSFADLFNALAAKARVQQALYAASGQPALLENAVSTWEAALLLARSVQQGYEADASRLFLNNNLQPASEDATAAAFALYKARPSAKQLQRAFLLAETSKAAVLQIRLQQASIANRPGMPAELLRRQQLQQMLLGRLRVQYEMAGDTALIETLRQRIRDEEIRLAEVNQQLNDDPAYAAAINEKAGPDIRRLQQGLSDDMAMVSYYFIRSSWIAFVLRKDSLAVRELPAAQRYEQLLQTMKEQLPSPQFSASQLEDAATALHQWLVQPLLPALQNTSRLIILPDHDLQSVPFEILAGADGKKLCEDYAISYNYSAVFFTQPAGHPAGTVKQGGFAPFGGEAIKGAGHLQALPASGAEIAAVQGERFAGTAATKQAFIRNAPSYGIIHLATHAAANDRAPENSFIAFYPAGADTSYKLYQPEIYNLDLRAAHLVILSACETGRGQFVHGEGMMSLARAFSYAGCRSVITSLWKADDAATAYITKRLHHHLQQGKPKDVALQQAKRDYLRDDAIAGRLKAPAFWSHLVLIGDASPLYKTSSFSWWMAAAGGVLVLALILIARKKRA